MPPKTKFSKADVIEAAFELAKAEGFTGITARGVASRLGCSVAPIYVNFATIEELVEAVVKRVFSITDELLGRQNGPNVFENIGRASIAFAREYPVLLRELVLQPNPYMASYASIESAMIELLAQDESLRGWTLEQRQRLLFKVRVFQVGLSVMVANGHIPCWLDESSTDEVLMEAGDDFVLASATRMEANQQ